MSLWPEPLVDKGLDKRNMLFFWLLFVAQKNTIINKLNTKNNVWL
jgi:hypothetical protein